MLDSLRAAGFQVAFHSHAEGILGVDFGEVAEQLEGILATATVPIEKIIGSGGGETKGLPASLVTFGEPDAVVERLIEEGDASVE